MINKYSVNEHVLFPKKSKTVVNELKLDFPYIQVLKAEEVKKEIEELYKKGIITETTKHDRDSIRFSLKDWNNFEKRLNL